MQHTCSAPEVLLFLVRIKSVDLLTVYVDEVQLVDPLVPNRTLEQLALKVKDKIKLPSRG